MARMSITFDGFKDMAEMVDRVNPSALKPAVDKALNQTANYVQTNVDKASLPYAHKGLKGYATGEMFKALKKDNPVYWQGYVAEVSVGFNLYEHGGFHSIFVMYGTPRMSKDPKLYNSIKGTKTKKDVEKIQIEVLNGEFLKAIKG